MYETTNVKSFTMSRDVYTGLAQVIDSHLMESLELEAPELNEIKAFYPAGYKRMVDDVLLSYARLAA